MMPTTAGERYRKAGPLPWLANMGRKRTYSSPEVESDERQLAIPTTLGHKPTQLASIDEVDRDGGARCRDLSSGRPTVGCGPFLVRGSQLERDEACGRPPVEQFEHCVSAVGLVEQYGTSGSPGRSPGLGRSRHRGDA
jgi:hypothetical protein